MNHTKESWGEMTERETLISEIIDRILKANPDKTEDDEEYLEKARIVRIIRGLEP